MKICLVSNIAAHYREEIYSLMDAELDCDFVFGDTLNNGIKMFDTSQFRNKVTILRNLQHGEITLWQKGVVKEILKKYDAFIVSDDIRCISTWLILIIARILMKKVYFWAHGWYGREDTKTKIVKHIFYRLPKGIFLYGNYSKVIMLNKGFDSQKLWVIHNSLSYSTQIEIRKKLLPSHIYINYFNNSNPTLIYIGRLTQYKRLHMIVEAMKILDLSNLKFNLILIGDGEEKNHLKNLVQEADIVDRVWFYGASYNEEINAELIYNADLCVSPGNIGLTAIHVMMYGTPAITHNNFKYQGPEFESIKSGITGDFYEYENLESLAEVIRRWFESNQNNRENVRQACFTEVDSFWTPKYQLNVIKDNLK